MYLAVALAAGLWLVLAISAQLSFRVLTHLRRWDPLGFVPSWHFFAPNPARFDTVVLIREGADATLDSGAPPAPWSVGAILYKERWYQSFFNPQRRIQKAVHDLQNALGNLSDHHDAPAICRSAPAQALFGYVLQHVEQSDIEGRHAASKQFAIVRVENTRTQPDARVVFVSSLSAMDD